MKSLVLNTVLLTALWLASGCSSGDSSDKIKRANDERIDKLGAAISDEEKERAKRVASSLVDLIRTSVTEFELSKVALSKAVNPQVKSYAQQTMNGYQQQERDLRTLARQLNVTLPTDVPADAKDRVGDLQDVAGGTAFDVEYLSEMAEINDKAVDLSDDLGDDAPNDQVRDFARKLREAEKKHRTQARELKNVLE